MEAAGGGEGDGGNSVDGGLKSEAGGKGAGFCAVGFTVDSVEAAGEADSGTGEAGGSGTELGDEGVVTAVPAGDALKGSSRGDGEAGGGALIVAIDRTGELATVTAVGDEVEVFDVPTVPLWEVMIVSREWDLGPSVGAVSFWLVQRRNCKVDLPSPSGTNALLGPSFGGHLLGASLTTVMPPLLAP